MNLNEKYEFVYVENDGTVREFDDWEKAYLEEAFEPTDGARPYIKSTYDQLTPDDKLHGFLRRDQVPDHIEIVTTELRYAEVGSPFSIHNTNIVIELSVGFYGVHVLDGWGVTLGNFNLELINKETGDVLIPKIFKLRPQDYKFGVRAKKIMRFDITKRGVFHIRMKNPEDVIVKRSPLFFENIFFKPTSNDQIRIVIG